MFSGVGIFTLRLSFYPEHMIFPGVKKKKKNLLKKVLLCKHLTWFQ